MKKKCCDIQIPTRSIEGPRGIPGISIILPGARGQTGATGPQGLTGAVSDFGMFYGLTAGTGNTGVTDYAATIAAKTSVGTGRVPFPRIGVASTGYPPTLLADNASINLPQMGVYSVTYNVHTSKSGQIQIELNGVDLEYTCSGNFNPSMGGRPIGGTYFIRTTVINSILAIVNPSGNSPALTITPANGSKTHANTQTLTIIKIN